MSSANPVFLALSLAAAMLSCPGAWAQGAARGALGSDHGAPWLAKAGAELKEPLSEELNELETRSKTKEGKQAGSQEAPVEISQGSAGPATAKRVERVEDEAFKQSDLGLVFGAMALATTDRDWAAGWQAKTSKLPKIKEVRVVGEGEPVDLVVFLASRSKMDLEAAPLTYEVSIYQPDGTLKDRIKNSVCLSQGTSMGAEKLGVCETLLKFEIERGDPRGLWAFKFKINTASQAPLVFGTSFETY